MGVREVFGKLNYIYSFHLVFVGGCLVGRPYNYDRCGCLVGRPHNYDRVGFVC